MAIYLITGVPGAGKTYLAVCMLIEKYYEPVEDTGYYKLREEYKDLLVVTNIDELALEAESLDGIFKKTNKNFESFFTEEYQETIEKKYKRVLYVIDEAQRYISPYFRNQKTILYFDTHRHLGHDIWLITQDRYKITRQIASLVEFEYRAVKRTLSFFGELKYNIISSGEVIERKVLRPKKEIFNLYKSFTSPETQKQKKPFIKILGIPLILLCISGFFLYKRMSEKLTKNKNIQVAQKQEIATKQINTIQNNPLTKPAPKITVGVYQRPKDITLWRKVSCVRFHDTVIGIYEPVTNQLYPPKIYPYPIQIAKRDVWADLPLEAIEALKRNEEETRDYEDGDYEPEEEKEEKEQWFATAKDFMDSTLSQSNFNKK